MDMEQDMSQNPSGNQTALLGEQFGQPKYNIIFSVILQHKRKRKTGIKNGDNPWKDHALPRPL